MRVYCSFMMRWIAYLGTKSDAQLTVISEGGNLEADVADIIEDC